MNKVINIFNEIQSTNSKNEKEEIIRINKDIELFRRCLIFLLDSDITTGISKSKINKELFGESATTIHNLFELMDYLEENNTGRDEDILTVQNFVDSNIECTDFIKGIATKDIVIGIDYKTVNKAIPNLIDKWEVQLGSSFEKLKLKDDEWFSISQKLNGNRCSFYNGKLLSRQGKKFNGMQHIIDDVIKLGLQDYFIDGELIRKNTDNISDGENFRIGTGIINSDKSDKSEIKFVVFDMFPKDELTNKQSIQSYKDRCKLLESIDVNSSINIETVRIMYQGIDQSKIYECLDYAIEHDWEGVMVNKDAPYKCKRTTDLIKVKKFYTMDLRIIGAVEGDGRLKGTLGAIVVEFKGNTVNVGSGYSDAQRDELWNSKDELIGKIAEIKYKEITKDKKTNLESLQFPIFCMIRNDKNDVSFD